MKRHMEKFYAKIYYPTVAFKLYARTICRIFDYPQGAVIVISQ